MIYWFIINKNLYDKINFTSTINFQGWNYCPDKWNAGECTVKLELHRRWHTTRLPQSVNTRKPSFWCEHKYFIEFLKTILTNFCILRDMAYKTFQFLKATYTCKKLNCNTITWMISHLLVAWRVLLSWMCPIMKSRTCWTLNRRLTWGFVCLQCDYMTTLKLGLLKT